MQFRLNNYHVPQIILMFSLTVIEDVSVYEVVRLE